MLSSKKEIIDDTPIDEISLAKPLIPDLGDVDEFLLVNLPVNFGYSASSFDQSMQFLHHEYAQRHYEEQGSLFLAVLARCSSRLLHFHL